MDSSGASLLFGVESELGFTANDPDGRRIGAAIALDRLLRTCRDRLTHLPGRGGVRLYLGNGGLIYPDVGHPELATAECSDPRAVLASLRACEALLTDAAEALAGQPDVGGVNLYRSTVDYDSGSTWGNHESYCSREEPWAHAAAAVPHLVSRIVYTGSGGFDNTRPGARFVLSPRTPHLGCETSFESQSSRAIFSVRDEALSNEGYYRVHLICGDANCSELSTYLKVGTTAVVLAMADAGVDFGLGSASLQSPVQAMALFARDPRLEAKALCVDGRPRTALEIQRHYLALAEKHLGASFMPGWAEELTGHWRSVLDRLERDPRDLAGWLDWPTKLEIFERYVASQSTLSWDSLLAWTKAVEQAAASFGEPRRGPARFTAEQLKRCLAGCGETLDLFGQPGADAGTNALDWNDYPQFLRLRDELCELDLRYGLLYPGGLYSDLEAAGCMKGRLIAADDIERARDRAPEPGRARLRGEWIKRLAGREGYGCDWAWIRGRSQYLDLGNPFATEACWQPVRKPHLDLSSRNAQLEVPAFLRSRRDARAE